MELTAKGCLFDLDGTLVDSLHVVERAWCDLGEKLGLSSDYVINNIHGKPASESIRHFMPHATEEELHAMFKWIEKRETDDTDGITALPGAIALLKKLDELSIPWAIVTSGTVPIATARHAVAQLAQPQHWVTAENIKQGKPAPDPYLLGAQLLGLKPEDCFVFEDATAGILSGLSAGCQVIAVHVPEGTPRQNEIALVVDSLEQLSIHKMGDKVHIKYHDKE